MTIHHVFANRSNAGDWLSAKGIQLLLGDVAVDEHLCDEPFVEQSLARLAALAPSDVVVVGGGGLLMDYFTPFWDGLVEIRARLCLWGVGVVDIKREPSLPPRDVLRRVRQRAEVIVVRDGHTADLLGGGPDIGVAPCPSVVAVPKARRGSLGLLHVANMTTVGEQEYETMRAVGQRWAAATGRVYRETNNRHSADERGLEAVLALYRSSDIVLSSALHGCLIAAAMGRPVVAVSGDRKIDEMMAQFCLNEWLLSQEEIGHIEERLTDALAHQPPPVAALERARVDGEAVAARVRTLEASSLAERAQ